MKVSTKGLNKEGIRRANKHTNRCSPVLAPGTTMSYHHTLAGGTKMKK